MCVESYICLRPSAGCCEDSSRLDQLAADGLEALSDPAAKALVGDWCAANQPRRRSPSSANGTAASSGWTTARRLRRRGSGQGRTGAHQTVGRHRPGAAGPRPQTAAALASGELSWEKAAAVATAVTPEVAAAFAEDEAGLLHAAGRLTVDETKRHVAHRRNLALAELDDDPHERARARRDLQTWRTRDGLLGFKGYVGPDEAPTVAAALEPANQLWHADGMTRAAAGLDPKDDNHLPDGLTLARTPVSARLTRSPSW